MKRILSVILALASIWSCALAAEPERTFISNGSVTFDGVGEKNANVTLTVLKPGMTLDDFMSEDNSDMPICYRDMVCDENGKYSFVFDIGQSSGIFNAYIGGDGLEEIENVSILYVNEEENENVRNLLLADNADVKQILANNSAALGIRKGLSEKMTDELYAETADVFKASTKPENTLDAVRKAVEKAAAIVLRNHNMIQLFGEEKDSFSVPESVEKWYEKSYISDAILNKIDSNMSKNITSIQMFDAEVAEYSGLAVIEYADGFGDVKDYLTENAATLSINKNKITDAFCKSIIGKHFNNISDIGIDKFKEPQSSLGGSTGGGSRGGSAYSNTLVQNPEKSEPEPITEQKSGFSDIDDFEWAREAIESLFDQGVINGKQSGIFAPGDNVLREEFAKIILSATKFEKLSGSVIFDDVNQNDWFMDYVTQAYLCGILKGESPNMFGSGKMILRQDMAVMCYNALLKKGVISEEVKGELNYVDSDDVDDYAKTAVGLLSSVGIINGNDDNMFMPNDYATRAEAAQMVYKVQKYISENK